MCSDAHIIRARFSGVIDLRGNVLNNKKIETAISSFDIAYMNNVKWENLFNYLVQRINENSLFVLSKPVWGNKERRTSYRADQISRKGVRAPGIFGNDREEYKEIEYMKIMKNESDEKEILKLQEYCLENKLKFENTEAFIVILGYGKS